LLGPHARAQAFFRGFANGAIAAVGGGEVSATATAAAGIALFGDVGLDHTVEKREEFARVAVADMPT
jgi:hypothetical protein